MKFSQARADEPVESQHPARIGNSVPRVLLLLLALGLHHAGIVANVNLSIADAVFSILVLVLIVNHQLIVPKLALLYLFGLLIFTIVIGAFVTPLVYSYASEATAVIRGFVKLGALTMYLVVGYSLAHLDVLGRFFKYFASGAIGIVVLGTISGVVQVPYLSSQMHYMGVRFRGFFDDPNYLAAVLVAAFVTVIRIPRLGRGYRIAGASVLALGVLQSGSKTGAVVLAAYSAFALLSWLRSGNSTASHGSQRVLGVLGLGVLGLGTAYTLRDAIRLIVTQNTSAQRIATVFIDTEDSLDSQGSSRQLAWSIALRIIEQNPLTGIGLGTYSTVANITSGSGVIAHNTYLQLAAEWGLPLSILSFALVLGVMIRARRINTVDMIIARDIMVVMLIASISISLNNVRIAWLLLGVLLYGANQARELARTRGT